MMRVLDHRDAQAAGREPRDELLDQRRLAAAGIAGDTKSLHHVNPAGSDYRSPQVADGIPVQAPPIADHPCFPEDHPPCEDVA
jgi:hypothetical protein